MKGLISICIVAIFALSAQAQCPDCIRQGTTIVPQGYHAHRAHDGSIVVHHNSNNGVPGAHAGMSKIRIAEGGDVVSDVAYSSVYAPVVMASDDMVIAPIRYVRARPILFDGPLRRIFRGEGPVRRFFMRIFRR